MKRILIVGKNSYIGKEFEKHVKEHRIRDSIKNKKEVESYKLDLVGARDKEWEKVDLEKYDVIIHLAGIVHQNEKKVLLEEYYKINTELTLKIALKAKKSNVKQFIFMSTASVYGNKNSVITKNTATEPNTFYGISKLAAENKLKELESKEFKICIIRPPMVYGKNCTGNFRTLLSFAKKNYIYPTIKNERSMIYIDNLCEMIYILIEKEMSGYYHPQNREYVSSVIMMGLIRNILSKKTINTRMFNKIIKKLSLKNSVFNKIFGDFKYDKELSEYKEIDYCKIGFEESIRKTIDK